jgi:hypothetical protein
MGRQVSACPAQKTEAEAAAEAGSGTTRGPAAPLRTGSGWKGVKRGGAEAEMRSSVPNIAQAGGRRTGGQAERRTTNPSKRGVD